MGRLHSRRRTTKKEKEETMIKIPKTINEAKTEVAKRWQIYWALRKEYGMDDEGDIAQGKSIEKYSKDLDEEKKRKLDFAQFKIDKFNLALYSLPWFKKIMRVWMVDVKFGNESPLFSGKKCGKECDDLSTEDFNKNIELLHEDPDSFTEKNGGTIMKNVSDYLISRGYTITDRGGSCCGGHIGCPCTDEECELLLNLIHIQFKKAIDSGMIFPTISWFRPNLPGFKNEDAIREWIETNGGFK